jgi:hypothetical protein
VLRNAIYTGVVLKMSNDNVIPFRRKITLKQKIEIERQARAILDNIYRLPEDERNKKLEMLDRYALEEAEREKCVQKEKKPMNTDWKVWASQMKKKHRKDPYQSIQAWMNQNKGLSATASTLAKLYMDRYSDEKHKRHKPFIHEEDAQETLKRIEEIMEYELQRRS